MLREARAEGDRLIDAAKAEIRSLAGEIEGLERSRRAYLAQLRAMVARQLSELEAIPEATAGVSGAASGPAGASPAPAGSAPSGTGPAAPAAPAAAPAASPAAASAAGSADNGADAARSPAQTPAWLNTVPAE